MRNSFELIPNPASAADPVLEHWLRIAGEVADVLRETVVERDLANEMPLAEVALLKQRGLLTIPIPKRYGGGGVQWRVTQQVVRRIARSDASIAQVLGYHYGWLRLIESNGGENGAELLKQSATGNFLWAGSGSARGGSGSNRTGLAELVSAADEDGYIVNSNTGFATGAPVADRVIVRSLNLETNRYTLVVIDPKTPGVQFKSDWDVLGQRLSASRGVELKDVSVPSHHVLGPFNRIDELPTPGVSLSVLVFQLLFSTLHLGIAEGAVLEAADYVRTQAQPWLHAEASSASTDPHIVNRFGGHVAQLQAVSALIDKADEALTWLIDRADEIDYDQRWAAAELIASAKVTSTQAGLEITSGIFDATGARGTTRRHGLDRFWRNLRTMSLHDPLAYKLDEIGQYFLNGKHPAPSGYR